MRIRTVLMVGLVTLLVVVGCNGEGSSTPEGKDSNNENSKNEEEIEIEPEFIPQSEESSTKDAILKIYHVGHLTTGGGLGINELTAEIPLVFEGNDEVITGSGFGKFQVTLSDAGNLCKTTCIQEVEFTIIGEMLAGCTMELSIKEKHYASQTTISCYDIETTAPCPGYTIPGKIQKIPFKEGKFLQEGEEGGFHWIYSFEIVRVYDPIWKFIAFGDCEIRFEPGEE